MFSLIISIIAIALTGALALASIYYGGQAYLDSIEKTKASTIINQAQQIQGGFQIAILNNFKFDSATSSELTDRLVEGLFLKEAPKLEGVDWQSFELDGTTPKENENAKLVALFGLSDQICDEIEKMQKTDFKEDSIHSTMGENSYGCTVAGDVYYKL